MKKKKAMKHAGLKAGFLIAASYPLFSIMIAVSGNYPTSFLLQPKLIIAGLAAALDLTDIFFYWQAR